MGKWMLLVVFLVAGVSFADEFAHVYDANAGELKAATAAVGQGLKDPSSVQLRNVKVRVDPDRTLARICGEFNAKNGYGAYVGFQKFYGDIMEGNDRTAKKFPAAVILSSERDAQTQCNELGMP